MSTVSRSVFVERGPVSLGCGTLILIALIVLIFSSHPPDSNSAVKSDIRHLQTQIELLQKSVEAQAEKLNQLEQLIRQRDTKQSRPIQPEAPAKE